MPILKTIDTECPNCETSITLAEFDPEDKSDETGQNIACEECGAEFEEWTWDASTQTLTIDEDSMIDDDEKDELEEPGAALDETEEDGEK